MTCRDEILSVMREMHSAGKSNVTMNDVVSAMKRRGSSYKESTIRTHMGSRMLKGANQNHATKFDDIELVERGQYRLCAHLRVQ